LTRRQFKLFRKEVYTFFNENIEGVHDNHTKNLFISKLRELVSSFPARITTAIQNNFGREKALNKADLSVLSPLFYTIEQLDQYLTSHVHELDKKHDTKTFPNHNPSKQRTFFELESNAFDQLLTIIFNILNSQQLYLKKVTHGEIQKIKKEMVEFADFLRTALTKKGEVIDVIECEREITKRITSMFSTDLSKDWINVRKYNLESILEILESILQYILKIKEKGSIQSENQIFEKFGQTEAFNTFTDSELLYIKLLFHLKKKVLDFISHNTYLISSFPQLTQENLLQAKAFLKKYLDYLILNYHNIEELLSYLSAFSDADKEEAVLLEIASSSELEDDATLNFIVKALENFVSDLQIILKVYLCDHYKDRGAIYKPILEGAGPREYRDILEELELEPDTTKH
jgi:hypothetical protein